MPKKKLVQPEALPEPVRVPPVVSDPLLEDPSLTEDEKVYLKVLAEVGMPYLAMDETWKRHKVRVNKGKLMAWNREHEAFREAYDTLKHIYADRLALENLTMSKEGKIAGGAAALRAQQLNRLLPAEYMQNIVQQVHTTVTYKADGAFSDAEEKPKTEEASTPTTEVLAPSRAH